MSDGVRVWEVRADDSLDELRFSKMNREERIETWITQNVSLLAPDESGLLVIGRQIKTDFGKIIDLLCMTSDGDLVIVELKRDKTPREVTAQALEYASWVQGLDASQIESIAADYLKTTLKEAAEKRFDEYPEVLNGRHSIKIVASEVDDSTERIIRYLSSNGIDINFIRFHFFESQLGKQFLVRTFTVAPAEAEQNALRGAGNRHTGVRKTLQIRLEECTNEAEKAFIREKLADPGQRKDRASIALLYPAEGKIRFSARGRPAYMRINQKGRFSDDESFWNGHLSQSKLTSRNSGTEIAFNLYTQEDFAFFDRAMSTQLPSFGWLSEKAKERAEGEEDEE
jgi:hypothetical protein